MHPRYFITLALWSEEEPSRGGASLRNCGTDNFSPLPTWIPELRPGAGERISAILVPAPSQSVPQAHRHGRTLRNLRRNISGGGFENPAHSELGKKTVDFPRVFSARLMPRTIVIHLISSMRDGDFLAHTQGVADSSPAASTKLFRSGET